MAYEESFKTGADIPNDAAGKLAASELAARELIKELGAGLPEPEQVVARFPSTLVLDATKAEKTERQVARILALAAADATSALSAGEQERVAGLVPQVARRARVWKRLATELEEQAAATLRESVRVRKIADDLSEVALRIAQAQANGSPGGSGG